MGKRGRKEDGIGIITMCSNKTNLPGEAGW